MPQEFPKWLYPDGTAESGVLVLDAEQEARALADLPDPASEPADAPKRRGRPPKAE